MRSMEAYPRAAMERAMKVQDVMLQAMAKKITWWQAAAIAGDAVAYRRQPPPVVSGRTLVRPDRDSGRRHQRDLLRPAGGGGIDGDGDGRIEGSDRAQRRVLRAVQRSGKPFLADAEGGRQGGLPSPHASGAGVAGVGCADDPGLIAANPWPQRAQPPGLARPR